MTTSTRLEIFFSPDPAKYRVGQTPPQGGDSIGDPVAQRVDAQQPEQLPADPFDQAAKQEDPCALGKKHAQPTVPGSAGQRGQRAERLNIEKPDPQIIVDQINSKTQRREKTDTAPGRALRPDGQAGKPPQQPHRRQVHQQGIVPAKLRRRYGHAGDAQRPYGQNKGEQSVHAHRAAGQRQTKPGRPVPAEIRPRKIQHHKPVKAASAGKAERVAPGKGGQIGEHAEQQHQRQQQRQRLAAGQAAKRPVQKGAQQHQGKIGGKKPVGVGQDGENRLKHVRILHIRIQHPQIHRRGTQHIVDARLYPQTKQPAQAKGFVRLAIPGDQHKSIHRKQAGNVQKRR